MHCNVNGLSGKVQLIQDFLVDPFQTDILLITETHLVPLTNDASVVIPGFVLLRNDSGNSPKHGVCIYIRESLRFDKVDTSQANCLSLRLPRFGLYVFVVYRPPSNSAEQNQTLVEFLLSECADKETVLLGDFNLPSIGWGDTYGSPTATDDMFLNTFNALGLTQWISEPTFPRSGNTLDLLLSSEQDRMGRVQVHAPPPGGDHCSVFCEYEFDGDVLQSAVGQSRLLWHRGQYGAISSALDDVDWDFELAHLSAHDAFERLSAIVEPLVDQHVPRGTQSGQRRTPWKNNPPSSLKRRRQLAWEAYKVSRSESGRKSPQTISALQTFLTINSELRSFAATSQIEYERSLIARFKEDPKLLHSYMRHRKQCRSSVGPLRLLSNTTSDDPKEMADCLLETFSKVHRSTIPENPAPHQRCEARLTEVDFLPEEIHALLSKLDPNSAMGLDGFHPRLLRSCAPALTLPLHMIFLQSLLEGKLPASWKHSLIVPIFKKGSRHDPSNYRPVSLTSVPCKTLERVIAKELSSFFTENNILTEEQFGFRPGRSTEDQLIITYDEITKGLDAGHPVDLVMFDFAKAFDVVCHAILLEKLWSVGIQGKLISWLQDFLVDRSMRVLVKDTTSDTREVKSGVPQGSVLGPILFLLYINHIASNLTCSYKIFADDLKIFMKLENDGPQVSAEYLQRDIDTLHSTAGSWGLTMNLQKCAVLHYRRRFHVQVPIIYSLNGSTIPCVASYTDLGVIVDDQMKFHEHCMRTAGKAGGVVHNFLKSTRCRSSDFMLHVLETHIRPVLEYSSPVWNNGYIQDLKRLEAVQRLWTRNIIGLRNVEYGDRLRTLELFSVKGRLLRADMLKCWKIFHRQCQIAPEKLWDMNVDRRTRGHAFKINPRRGQVDARTRFFSHRVVRDWNELPGWLVQESSLPQFKKGLAEVLGDRLYEYHA